MSYNKHIKYAVWRLAIVLLETSLLRGRLLYLSGSGVDIGIHPPPIGNAASLHQSRPKEMVEI